jgi:catechol 2,3-dioxygenase-like lactoylglutathione lyase family enzyme
MMSDDCVHVRYIVHDVEAAIAFYSGAFGFDVVTTAAPAFAAVVRGNLRLLLSGPLSSAGRTLPDGTVPTPGGWNRLHFVVEDLPSEIARLRELGVEFRSPMVSGPGGSQIVLDDPSGNPIELFEPVRR